MSYRDAEERAVGIIGGFKYRQLKDAGLSVVPEDRNELIDAALARLRDAARLDALTEGLLKRAKGLDTPSTPD